MRSNERLLWEIGTHDIFLGKGRKTEEVREEIIKDEIFKEYTGGKRRVRIRNLGTEGVKKTPHHCEFWESQER